MRDYLLTFPLPLLPQSPYTLLIINIIKILSSKIVFIVFLSLQGTPEGQSLTPINLHILKVNKCKFATKNSFNGADKFVLWISFASEFCNMTLNLDFSEPLASWRWDPWPQSFWNSQRSFKVGRLERCKSYSKKFLIFLFGRNLDRFKFGGHVCACHKVKYFRKYLKLLVLCCEKQILQSNILSTDLHWAQTKCESGDSRGNITILNIWQLISQCCLFGNIPKLSVW